MNHHASGLVDRDPQPFAFAACSSFASKRFACGSPLAASLAVCAGVSVASASAARAALLIDTFVEAAGALADADDEDDDVLDCFGAFALALDCVCDADAAFAARPAFAD
ncbi:hypothetical protein D7S86_16435 [Pararobbsia silviterrae]|uniref:Uncharacterized protein n=1 Tax=Pararobbsia silviterrae TaxID=1792498 RepID=A0A494Y0F2_9BURK|nr:hypothetical protein D7S86_16435 [Pararobbsia silviterrae]